MDPDAYALHYVYSTRKCEKGDLAEKLVFFFMVGNKGFVYQF